MVMFSFGRSSSSLPAAVAILLLCAKSTRALTIVITGSSQGVGLDAATRLVADGHTVVHACRSPERARVAATEAQGGIPMVCDLADQRSIRNFAAELATKVPDGNIDVLCLNAAVAPSGKAQRPKLTVDGLEECIGVNHVGHFLLARLLRDRLGNNKNNSNDGIAGGRLVITASSVHDPDSPGGSVGGKGGATLGDLSGFGVRLDRNDDNDKLPTMPDGQVTYDGRKVYNDSKLCNVLFARRALAEPSWDGVSVRSFNPGFIPSSGLFREPRKDNFLGAALFTLAMSALGLAVPVSIGGARLAYLATADESEVPRGSYFSSEAGSRATNLADGFGPGTVSAEAADDTLARALWDRSLLLVAQEEESADVVASA